MVVVVFGRLLVEEPLLVGVLHPARLRDDREKSAQLAGDASELLSDLVDRPGPPGGESLIVDDIATARLPVRIGSLV